MDFRVVDVCAVGLALYLVRQLVRRKKEHFPPGPTGWPLIGNLLDFPTCTPYKTFGEMNAKYGPVIFFDVMGSRYVALNSIKAIKDLLEKNSAITCNRMSTTMLCDLVDLQNATAFLQSGDKFRTHRKLFHREIGTKVNLERYFPAEEEEAKQLARNLLHDSDSMIAHCRRMASAVTLRISHGYIVKSDHDPLVAMVDRTVNIFATVVTPGRFLVDTLPILQYLPEWFPGCGFLKDAKKWRKIVRNTMDTPYQYVLDQLAKGDALPSMTSHLIQDCVTPEDEEVLKWVSLNMFLGGSDTTSHMLTAFFLSMIIFPDVFKKAQAEVDRVVGNNRLPTMKDRSALPYVNALCKELLRWHVLVPMPPHVATQDIEYEGYLIPKGTCILPNVWYILNGPDVYPDPDMFKPERFLGENQQLDPTEMCFGFGRRVCPGVLLAESTLFTCITTVLATLNVSRCIENGVERVPEYDIEETMARKIKPFTCRIEARSKKAEELLQANPNRYVC